MVVDYLRMAERRWFGGVQGLPEDDLVIMENYRRISVSDLERWLMITWG
jgi:hypothetical protein